jgi:hypothetical protein
MKTLTYNTEQCPRCSRSHELVFEPLKNPREGFAYWAMCPVTKQPVILHSSGVALIKGLNEKKGDLNAPGI